MAEYKAKKGYKLDTEMTAEDWKALVEIFKASFKKHVGFDFPQDAYTSNSSWPPKPSSNPGMASAPSITAAQPTSPMTSAPRSIL